MAPSSEYNARHLSVLEGLEAVRKRPGMYIGSTDSRGLMHCLWEIIDNSVDEALAGFGHDIQIILHADNSVEIHDDGRGIPVDLEPKTGLTGVEVVFTKLHAGGKFGGGSYTASGGLHGVGASVVNALSARLDVQVARGGKTYQMSFRRGEPGRFKDTGSKLSPTSVFEPFVENSVLDVVGKAKRGVTGTRIRYWADRQIFTPDAKFAYEDLAARARQTSFLVPGLKLTVRDERRLPGTPGESGPHQEVFHHDGGISEFVDFLAADSGVTDIWRLHGAGKFKETVPVLDENGHSKIAEVERDCEVDIALRWGIGYETTMRSFVNIIATPKGGTHQSGFEQALLKTFRKAVETNARKLKAGNDKIEKDDVLAGLTAVLTVRLAEPQFEGQTKEILGTSAVRAIVAKVVEDEITARLNSANRNDKAQSALLLEKIVSEMKSRISARVHKETQRRKNALETSSMPTKLADCRTDDVGRSELFIVEGDSALGTAKLARSSDFQALLPIRGKILNVQKASVGDMLSNAECAALIQVVGAGSGRSFDIDAARYGKVILMTDADVDGAHIRTLLLTLFFRYMRPMIDEGRVYAAVPPLHRVEVINAGQKANEMIYTYSEAELHVLLARLAKEGKRYKEPIQRYKGLGEMDAEQLAETTMDPRHRTLRKVGIENAKMAEDTFDLLMGSDVAPRKDFIIAGAADLDRERIDA
ncbi:DNA gyrase/topoisomerase IV subunit B [Arthrobacter bambusae]|uniref:DNA topoisomerase (ATP-hydrolyzing) n=1 Tax=Arthrobacter bambusae TaxID=1338426 RepID=A0AAW8DJ36_9MICC|nr:DNA topoisomerase IV subunit B [Arthrobacter bambusae]MDP9906162.1 DNA gyrase subunit B [Arthrobacter bambusae]MDQ0131821.1 DNA gyrase subunit B [Arthrobacter bambusae]MDQ0181965.1 DNA gyrase subunit B [Arthrobacter bambusae]